MNVRVPPALYRHSPRFFVVFLALTVWAFWPTYFSRLFEQPTLLHHAHGVVLAAWLVMLVVQAQLIRRCGGRCTAGSASCRTYWRRPSWS